MVYALFVLKCTEFTNRVNAMTSYQTVLNIVLEIVFSLK